MAGSTLSEDMPFAALYDMVTDPSNLLGRDTRGLAEQLASFRASTSPLAVSFAIGSWLQGINSERGTLLVVDDADLIDEDSLRVVAYAVARYAPETTSVVCTHTRSVPLLERLQVKELHLKDLNRTDAVGLAVESGASGDTAPHLVDRLGGNPLALVHAAPAYGGTFEEMLHADVPVAGRLDQDVTFRMDPLGVQSHRL